MMMLTRPSLMQRLLASLERRILKAQGKGAGGHSIDAEVNDAVTLLPTSEAVVFDVGANKGLWSRALLKQGGARVARVFAFEPSRHNWPDIEAIADPRLSLIKMAVSDQIGEAELFSDAPGSGLASLSQRNLDHVGLEMAGQEVVALTTLDAFCAEQGIARIDFLKLDIEGHELAALKGARDLLERGAIGALSFEFGGANIDTRTYFKDFWQLLSGHGYAIWRIVPGSSPVPITRYHERLECFATTNFLAVKKD